MNDRPYVLLSCAMSVDGCLDAPGPQRLILSGDADLDRVDDERSGCDAIMVGAGTIRRDNPRLLIRSPARRAARAARGMPEHPAAVTLTASGDLDPAACFFTAGRPAAGTMAEAGTGTVSGAGTGAGAEAATASGAGTVGAAWPVAPARLVYCPARAAAGLGDRLAGLATVIGLDSERLPPGLILADLGRRGIRRLMIEGGASLAAQFLAAGLVDELQLAVAPFFVGDPAAPRFAPPGAYPHGPGRPMTLAGVRQLDGVVLLRYLLG
ncbi:MAG: dihydrofolate reductase family protein [Actinobacteria bacterium]|nr:dihydrofolate reductase family protein [Actinomycetota bacterium]